VLIWSLDGWIDIYQEIGAVIFFQRGLILRSTQQQKRREKLLSLIEGWFIENSPVGLEKELAIK